MVTCDAPVMGDVLTVSATSAEICSVSIHPLGESLLLFYSISFSLPSLIHNTFALEHFLATITTNLYFTLTFPIFLAENLALRAPAILSNPHTDGTGQAGLAVDGVLTGRSKETCASSMNPGSM